MKNVRVKVTLPLSMATVLMVLVVMSMMFPDTLALAKEQEALQVDKKVDGARISKYHFSGPYAYKNLAIFLIHAEDRKDTSKFMTLEEALEQKKVTIRETGTVNTLVIENVSDDVHVYIQSGDIVRGGKQDRTLGYDYVIPPRSGKTPLSSFCVERGRWRQIGNEKADEFSVSNKVLPSKGLKIATNYGRSQSSVWKEVDAIQNKLSSNLGQSVRSKKSESSLELTLENVEVKKAVREYVNAFSRLIENRKDTVGFAFAINGKVDGADVYSSAKLFKKLWPKLLQASSVEAITEIQKTKEYIVPTVEAVHAFLQNDEKAKISKKQINEQLKVITRQSKDKIVFETYKAGQQQALHKNYVRVEPNLLKQKIQPMRNTQTRLNITHSNREQQQGQRR
ncbi:MAG: hypothetical protein HQ580_05585 [Planctomycetes bacterium]|nr:hypothetical protein [Planctomycetota bacterium]